MYKYIYAIVLENKKREKILIKERKKTINRTKKNPQEKK